MPYSDLLQVLVPRLSGRFLQGTISTPPFSRPCSSSTSPGRVFPPRTTELPGISSLPPMAIANIPYRQTAPAHPCLAHPFPICRRRSRQSRAPACRADGGARHSRSGFMVIRNSFHVCANSNGPAPSPHPSLLSGLGLCHCLRGTWHVAA